MNPPISWWASRQTGRIASPRARLPSTNRDAVGESGREGVRLVHDSADGDAHGGAFLRSGIDQTGRGDPGRGDSRTGLYRIASSGVSIRRPSWDLDVSARSRIPAGQQRPLDRIGGPARVDHLLDGVEQEREMGIMRLLPLLDVRGQELVLAADLDRDADCPRRTRRA